MSYTGNNAVGLPPLESTSCLSFQVRNPTDSIAVVDTVFNLGHRIIKVQANVWVNVTVTLEVIKSWHNKFEIIVNKADLDNIQLVPGVCDSGIPIHTFLMRIDIYI